MYVCTYILFPKILVWAFISFYTYEKFVQKFLIEFIPFFPLFVQTELLYSQQHFFGVPKQLYAFTLVYFGDDLYCLFYNYILLK